MNSTKKFTYQLLFLSLLFIVQGISAQVSFDVNAEIRKMSKGDQMSYTIDIPQADLKTVTKNWIKLLQEETKQKAIVSEHEIYIEGALVPEIVQKPINIYSYIYEVDSMIRVYSFFEIDSVFFAYSGNKDDIVGEKMYAGITNFTRKFAVGQYAIAVENELENEQKTLKSLLGELDKLEKDNQDLQKVIKENEQNIAESNDEIKLLDADNDRTISAISTQREVVSGISDKELKKTEQKELKNLESERKKIGNKLEKEQKRIVEYDAAIDKSKADIEKNLQLQEEKKKEIETQEEVVKSVEIKLDGIKEAKKNLIDKIFN